MPRLTEEEMQMQMANIGHSESDRRNFTKNAKDYLEQGGNPHVQVQGPVGDNSYEYKIGLPHLLVQQEAPNTFKTYLEKGGDINMPDTFGRTAAHYSLSSFATDHPDHAKDAIVLKDMILDKANLTLPDKKGVTPIEEAYGAAYSHAKQTLGVKSKEEFFKHLDAKPVAPELSHFNELHTSLTEKYGEGKLKVMAEKGVDKWEKERNATLERDAMAPFQGVSNEKKELPYGPKVEALAQNLSTKGVSEGVAYNKPDLSARGGPAIT